MRGTIPEELSVVQDSTMAHGMFTAIITKPETKITAKAARRLGYPL